MERRDDYELCHQMQAAGVPSPPVLEARVFDDPQLQAREMFRTWEIQDDIGPFRYMAPFLSFPRLRSLSTSPL